MKKPCEFLTTYYHQDGKYCVIGALAKAKNIPVPNDGDTDETFTITTPEKPLQKRFFTQLKKAYPQIPPMVFHSMQVKNDCERWEELNEILKYYKVHSLACKFAKNRGHK